MLKSYVHLTPSEDSEAVQRFLHRADGDVDQDICQQCTNGWKAGITVRAEAPEAALHQAVFN